MKQLIFTLFFCLAVGNVYGQYQGIEGNYYDAHDVDKLLTIKAANPQANLNWSGNDYGSDTYIIGDILYYSYDNGWPGCRWTLGADNVYHLSSLSCYDNQLTSLDVSGCTSLATLDCSSNQLTSVNVSGCTSLTTLKCYNNQLTDENLPSLYGLNIRPYYIIEENWSYFDLRGNKGFHESAIRTLADSLPNITYEQILYDKISETDSLSVSPTSLNFAVSGGQQTFEVTSNTDWAIGQDSTWFVADILPSLDSESNTKTVTVTAMPNTSNSQRTASITVKGTDAEEQTVSVSQDAYSIELLSSDSTLPMKGVAADGAAQLIIRLKYTGNNPDVKEIKYTLVNDNISIDATDIGAGYLEKGKQNGQILDLPVDSSMFTFSNGEYHYDVTYTAPNEFNEGADSGEKDRTVSLKLEITFQNQSVVDISAPDIEIIRPPLLMVHGLGGSYDTFTKMSSYFVSSKYNWWQVYSLDYSASNTSSFNVNRFVVPNNILLLLRACRNNQYEASRVDVVAHSMGGLLTRQYLQSIDYRVDINKFITLNTPHSGSQGANLLMDISSGVDVLNSDVDVLNLMSQILFLNDQGVWKKYIDNIDGMRDEYYTKFNNFVNSGAVADLCVNSDAIKALRNNESISTKVPTHAIYTTTGLTSFLIKEIPQLSPVEITMLIIAESITAIRESTLGSVFLASNFVDNLYGGENDLIVAAPSQIGGLDIEGGNSAITLITDQFHCSTENPLEIAEVDRLLSSSKLSDAYSTQGFNPPELSYTPPKILSTSLKSSTDASNIKIVSIDKPNCKSNDEVKIRIAGSSDITSMSLLIQGEVGNIYMESKEGNDSVFSYTVPEEAIGYKKILAIGYTNSQTTVIDTASLNISTSASLISITTSPDNETLVPLYGKQQVQVLGTYSDSTTKNISYLNNIQFAIKGSNAGLEAPNTILGLKEGTDTLVVSCQGLEVSLPMHIIDVGLEPTAIESPNAKIQEMLKCYPNPAKEQVTIAYELTESCSYANVNIYDMSGQAVKTVELKNKTAGYHEEAISIGDIPKGIYIVVLSTDKGNSYQKLMKE